MRECDYCRGRRNVWRRALGWIPCPKCHGRGSI